MTKSTAAADRQVFKALFETFGASTAELAESTEMSVDRTRAALKRLEAHGLAAPQDVNDEAQGGRRRGSFKSLAWCAQPSHDDATWDEADAAFSAAYELPTEADEEPLPPTKRGRRNGDGVDPDVAAASVVLNDPSGSTKPGSRPKAAATAKPRAAKTADDAPASTRRKLVAKIEGGELILRMSVKQQQACIAATGSLPKAGDVEFRRADGTKTADIVTAKAES